MEIANRVNLDFDQALAQGSSSFKKEKLIAEFEYIYFLVEDDAPLYSNIEYEKEYLEYLVDKGFSLPRIVSGKNEWRNWWGDLTNIEESQEANSKIFNTVWAKGLELCPHFVEIIRAEIELESYLKQSLQEKHYYRAEFGFSGINNKVIHKEKKYSFRYPGVISKFLEIELNFGVTVNLKTLDYFIIKNEIDDSGRFCGGSVISNVEIAEKLMIDIETLKKQLDEIFNLLRDRFGPVIIEFDSFIYKENETPRWYKIVEINARKTMGLVVKALHDKYGQGVWHIKGKTSFNNYSEQELDLSEKVGGKVVITSPNSSKLLSYYTYN